MAVAPLPPALEDRLAALAARVRRLRVARGACDLAAVALLVGLVVVLSDAVLSLPVAVRCLLLMGWLGLVVFLAWGLVVRPWQEGPSPEDLAGVIEGHFPGLGARLLSVTSRDTELVNGTPHLLLALTRDTARRFRALDVGAAAPARPVVRHAAVVGLLYAAAVGAVAAVPGADDHVRRVGVPWSRAGGVAPFEVIVASGDPVVRRGDPVTLTAYLRLTGSNGTLPGGAVLLVRDAQGTVTLKLPMTGDSTAAFYATLPGVTSDFEYRVESGSTASDWHQVLVADPVELADQTAVEVVPPAYAGSPPPPVAGFAAFGGLQYSTATIRLRFNRQAETVTLEWRPDDRSPDGDPDRVPVQLTPDRTGGVATFPLQTSGMLRLALVNEFGPRKLRTELAVPVRVAVDVPPRFEQVAGVPARPCTVRPGERVPVGFTAVDDVGIAAAEVEYAVGASGGKPGRVPIPMSGAGTPHAEGWALFDLTGIGRPGDVVRYRLRVTDGRRVDDPRLGPQVTVYPPSGWAELRLAASAPPFDRQDIFARRDALRDALTAVQKEIAGTKAEAEALRTDTAGRSPLPVDHAARLDGLRARVRKAAALLHDAAGDAGLTPEVRAFAGTVRAVAEQPLRACENALGRAATDSPADRQAALGDATARLTEAARQVNDRLGSNDRLARDRLDRRRLAAVAADQAALADRVKEDVPLKELLAAQRGLHDRLTVLLADSDPLRRGVSAAATRDAAALAADVTALADSVRKLDTAAARLTATVRGRLLDDLAREQRAFADRAAAFYPTIDTAARVARVRPPTSDDFRRAAELFARDKLVDAAVELEKFAQALDRAADEFDKWATDRADPKHAARQLARWQDELRGRLAGVTKDTPFNQLPDAVKGVVRTEQAGLLRAAGRLGLPPDPEVTALRDAALTHLRLAAKWADGDGAGIDAAMKNAADALTRLADRTPTVAERIARVRPEFDKLRQEQHAVAGSAEGVLRPFEKTPPGESLFRTLAGKLVALRDRQQAVADRLAALDLPGLEPRRERTVAALRAAAADMTAGLPHDTAAALGVAKREIDRLRQAADATPPPDDKADDPLPSPEGGVVLTRRFAEARRRAEADAKRLQGTDRNPDASATARQQLVQEAEMLRHTRVGAAGQAAVRRVLELYTRLQAKAEPDRQAADQKQLAEALDELTGTMAAGPELATGLVGPSEPDPADRFLPSKAAADTLRDMARRQRAARERANNLAAEVARWSTPAAANPLAVPDDPAVTAAELRERHRALAAGAGELARRLDRAAKNEPPGDPAARSLADAAGLVSRAGQSLADAVVRAAEAVKLREEAMALLKQVGGVVAAAHPAELTTGSAPDVAAVDSGGAVREAEQQMCRAIEALGPAGNRAAAVEAMRRAADGLGRAAKVVADR